MATVLEGSVTYVQLGLAFALVGVMIALNGLFSVSDRGLSAQAKGSQEGDLGWLGELCAQRYDLRWGALLIAVGFGLQLMGSASQSGTLDARLILALVIAVGAYLLIRGPTIRHDISAALEGMSGNVGLPSDRGIARLAKAA